MPPCSGGSDRYEGTQRFSPHQANIVAAFINVSRIASLLVPPDLRNDAWGLLLRVDSRQTSGSFTCRLIHRVKSAGTMPTKKTALHPQRGSTTALTTAAAPYPIAQQLCISPR